MEFRSILSLLEEGYTVEALSTVIENGDIGVWDRFGRFVLAQDERAEILDALADLQLSIYQGRDIDEPGPLYYYPYDDMSLPFNRFGWSSENLPDIEKIFEEWTKQNSFGGVTSRSRLRPNSAACKLIDALTILQFGEPVLETLKKPGANGIGMLRSKISKTGIDISEKSLSRIYRG